MSEASGNLGRQELKNRQGAGARYDADTAPADDLPLARRGTAFFARQLMNLSDEALYQPAANGGETNAFVVARISYAARQQAFAIEAVQGNNNAALDISNVQIPNLSTAATLPAHALRHLFRHTEVHLNVCWRDLDADLWDQQIEFSTRGKLNLSELPMLRAQQIWQAATHLGRGVSLGEIPERVRHGLAAMPDRDASP